MVAITGRHRSRARMMSKGAPCMSAHSRVSADAAYVRDPRFRWFDASQGMGRQDKTSDEGRALESPSAIPAQAGIRSRRPGRRAMAAAAPHLSRWRLWIPGSLARLREDGWALLRLIRVVVGLTVRLRQSARALSGGCQRAGERDCPRGFGRTEVRGRGRAREAGRLNSMCMREPTGLSRTVL